MSNPRYSILPARAVFDARLNHTELRVLAALGTYSDREGWCYPSQKELTEKLGIARSTLCAAIKRLSSSDIGYVDVRPRTSAGRGKVGNEYRVKMDLPNKMPMSDEEDIGEKPMSSVPDNGPQRSSKKPMSETPDNGADVRLAGQPMSSQPDIAYKALTTPRERPQLDLGETPPAKRKSRKRTAYSAEFETFWALWPQTWRERSDKQLAFRRWLDDIQQWPIETIMEAARRHIKRTAKEAHRFCGRADVFLNGKLEAAIEAVTSAPKQSGERWDPARGDFVRA